MATGDSLPDNHAYTQSAVDDIAIQLYIHSVVNFKSRKSCKFLLRQVFITKVPIINHKTKNPEICFKFYHIFLSQMCTFCYFEFFQRNHDEV